VPVQLVVELEKNLEVGFVKDLYVAQRVTMIKKTKPALVQTQLVILLMVTIVIFSNKNCNSK